MHEVRQVHPVFCYSISMHAFNDFFALTPGSAGDLSTIAIGEVVPDVKGDAADIVELINILRQ